MISGNAWDGVSISADSTKNIVEGNYIGTDVSGTKALGNGADGVHVQNACNANTIGGTALAAKNVISANAGWGVELDSTGNLVDWNYIGVDSTGAAGPGLPNNSGAVSAVPGNTIGTHNKP